MDVNKAKKNRTVLKCRLTKVGNNIRKLHTGEYNHESRCLMKSYQSQITEIWTQYCNIQHEITVAASEEDMSSEIADLSRIEDQYLELQAKCREFRLANPSSNSSETETQSTVTVVPNHNKPTDGKSNALHATKQGSIIGRILEKFKSTTAQANPQPGPSTLKPSSMKPDSLSSASSFHGFTNEQTNHDVHRTRSSEIVLNTGSLPRPQAPKRTHLNKRQVEQPSVLSTSSSSTESASSKPQLESKNLVKLIDALSSNLAAQSLMPHLPPVTFSGKASDWPEFRDLFLGISSKLRSNADRLLHLKVACKGGAADRLVKFYNTGDEYVLAWESLVAEYDQEKVTIMSHIKNFLHQKPVIDKSPSSLRSFFTTSDIVVRQLKALKYESRDLWLITILVEKLDSQTAQAWSIYSSQTKLPTIEEFLKFISNRCKALEVNTTSSEGHTQNYADNSKYAKQSRIKSHHTNVYNKHKSSNPTPSTSYSASYSKHKSSFVPSNCTPSTSYSASYIDKCIICKIPHRLHQCPDYNAMTPNARYDFIVVNSLCINCLRLHKSGESCPSHFTCRDCRRTHHSSIHTATNRPGQVSSHVAKLINEVTNGILPTAIVNIVDSTNNIHTVRILLDSASTTSFISESLVQMLRIKRRHQQVPVGGAGDITTCSTKGQVTIQLQSRIDSKKSFYTEANILTKVAGNLPQTAYSSANWNHLNGLTLADPHFATPTKVDILLGVQHFIECLEPGLLKGPPGQPDAINSIFGWLVLGDTGEQGRLFKANTSVAMHSTLHLDSLLKKFWEIEEVATKPNLSVEEQAAEDHFVQNTVRTPEGRFMVRLPFKTDRQALGNSLKSALAQAYAEEHRCEKNSEYKGLFHDFMNDIDVRAHWEEIPKDELDIPDNECYYMKRHGVLKESSTTTKLRVVVNASSPSSNGVSLNDNLMLGPPVQHELLDIMLRFRTHKFVFTADIEKMYRMVELNKEDANFQRILWRNNTDEPFKHFRLTTVIYGTRSAPFQATRALKECAKIYEKQYPDAAQVLLKDTYVDDVTSGCNDIEKCKLIMHDLSHMLSLCGFNLHKWSANHPQLLQHINKSNCETSLEIGADEQSHMKVLGIWYDTNLDTFTFKVNIQPSADTTRRTMLSEICRIYDPFGFLQPIIILGKMILQQVWLLGTEWDEPLPQHVAQSWTNLCNEFPLLNEISINRYVPNEDDVIHLHGFCDASETAYCAVIYAFTNDTSKPIKGNIVVSKTKVSPIKPLTIAKLELCAAVLLSKLMAYVVNSFSHLQIHIHAYTDSTTVMAWLSQHPSKWKTFVAQRVSSVIDIIPPHYWAHIPGCENPADIGTRGMLPSELKECETWFKGPDWLYKNSSQWPTSKNKISSVALTEMKLTKLKLQVFNPVQPPPILHHILSHISNYHKIVLVMANVQRAVFNFKLNDKTMYNKQPIDVNEYTQAELALYKMVQQETFLKEILALQTSPGQSLPKSSKLHTLYPFLDANGILRVGGRLNKSTHVSYDLKHPIILPGTHHFTKLIVSHLHNNIRCWQ